MGNWWYTSSGVQTVATVISTILDYGDREEVANFSTSYMPSDEIFTMFGKWAIQQPVFDLERSSINSEMGKLGIPSTLIKGGEYAATAVYRANETAVWGVPYPTPFLLWDAVQAYYNETRPCNTEEDVDFLGFPKGYQTIEIERSVAGAYYTASVKPGTVTDQYFYIQTLPPDIGDVPRGDYPLPTGAVDRFLSFQTNDYPWLTGCTIADTTGEPTVHIAVNQLTATSRVTVMAARTNSNQASRPTEGPPSPSIAPTTIPPPDANNGGPIPVQTPANTQVPNSGSAPDTESGGSPPQNPTTGEQQSGNPGETTADSASPVGTSSEDTSPDTQQSPASSNPQNPDSNQNNQGPQDADSDGTPSNPTVVVPEELPASGTVQAGAQGQTAASESGDIASDESGSSETGTDNETNGTTDSNDEDDDASAAGGSSATGDVGDAIMSGIGQTRTGSNGAGHTGPAYTGAAAALAAEIVLAVSTGLTWLIWWSI